MKYAKFGLILLSVLSVSGCAENTTNSGTPTDFLGSMKASIGGSLSAIPETISMYTGGSGASDELADVKEQLAQTQQKMQVLLEANAKHVQSLQSERVKLQQERSTLDLAMRQLKHLKRQLANQDGLLLELQKVLSTAEMNVVALSKGKGLMPASVLKVAEKPATQNLQQPQKAKQQKKIQQLSQAEQQKKMQQLSQAEQQKKMQQKRMLQQKRKQAQQARIQQQQARMLQQQKKQAQQARIQQQRAAQRMKMQQQQVAQQAKMQQQSAQNEPPAGNQQLKVLFQQRKRNQQEMQRLNKAQAPKKLESLALPE